MRNTGIKTLKKIAALRQFYELMDQTREVRLKIVGACLNQKPVEPNLIDSLKNALQSLLSIPQTGGKYFVLIDKTQKKKMEIDITYEVEELKKDIYYLQNGEDEFYRYLEGLYPGFSRYVEEGVDRLKNLQFNNFIADRDGTVNNYCGRYKSSIQSVYNSVFLTRFARNCTTNSIIITSAPLAGPGILDVSINSPNTFIYAASKAREFMDSEGKRRAYPIDPERRKKIEELNQKLSEIIKQPRYKKHSLIGSGLQFKFGQTTIARQDITNSIPQKESFKFLELIEKIVESIDPQGKYFVIEDTGKDIEIISTVQDDKNSLKDFDKGDGISYLDKELNLNLERGPNLICGDTASDLSMIKVSMDKTADTWSIFVTKDANLVKEVEKICPNSYIVPAPDMLVSILGKGSSLDKERGHPLARDVKKINPSA